MEPERSEQRPEYSDHSALTSATSTPACLLDQRLRVDRRRIAKFRRLTWKRDAHGDALVTMKLF
jgi:exosome complex RNA-binding protein Rrp42 (RNase PH superfamily)